MTPKFLQIVTAVDNQSEAEQLIKLIAEKRIGVSAQVQGPTIIDKPHVDAPAEDLKWRCKFKTTEELLPRVKEELRIFFPDGYPELTVLPIVKGSQPFFEWLEKELK